MKKNQRPFKIEIVFVSSTSSLNFVTMGKKAKSSKGAQRAKERKINKSDLPPPPKPLTDEVSSTKIQALSSVVYRNPR